VTIAKWNLPSLRHWGFALPHHGALYIYVSVLFEHLLTFGVKKAEHPLTVGFAAAHESLPIWKKV
jgi:hypothetical protein